jgi:hypothetical protein
MRSDIGVIVSLRSGYRGQPLRVNTAADQMDFIRLFYLCFTLKWWRITKIDTQDIRGQSENSCFPTDIRDQSEISSES